MQSKMAYGGPVPWTFAQEHADCAFTEDGMSNGLEFDAKEASIEIWDIYMKAKCPDGRVFFWDWDGSKWEV